MPKETIYPDVPQISNAAPLPVIQVGWQKDMDVQVGIRTGDDRHFIDNMLGFGGEETVENVAALGRSAWIHLTNQEGIQLVADFPDSDSERTFMFHIGCAIEKHVSERYPNWNSLWWHPSRYQINKLIKLLRAARDQAFGRDE